jgi:hypothetical protein
MLTARNLPASAATLKRLTAITLDFAQAHHLSAREVQALLDAVRHRVCAGLQMKGDAREPDANGRTEGTR